MEGMFKALVRRGRRTSSHVRNSSGVFGIYRMPIFRPISDQ
jgi:hypothetical protein